MEWKDFKKRKMGKMELVLAIVQDIDNKNVAMVGFQDWQAFKKTIETGEMWFYSTSRKKLWKKGEQSGNIMLVKKVSVDCDKDALLYACELTGGACHEGYDTCFYRDLKGNVVGKKLFDPDKVY